MTSSNIVGADLTDYFNYGFEERSWMLYCQRQQQLRDNGPLGPGGASSRNYGANHHSPRRFDSNFKRPMMQSGSIQVMGGSDRERDSGLGDNEERHHQRHGGRNSHANRGPNDFSGGTIASTLLMHLRPPSILYGNVPSSGSSKACHLTHLVHDTQRSPSTQLFVKWSIDAFKGYTHEHGLWV